MTFLFIFSDLKYVLTICHEEMIALLTPERYGKMITVEAGYAVCPCCRVNRKLIPIEEDTVAYNLQVYCRTCKRRIKIDIVRGQCFESQG